jgi:cardiolipin synthase A/B
VAVVVAENLVDGHRTLPVLLADLAAAERVIHVSMFLFFDDPISEEIERVLEARSRAGVAVRVLLNVDKTNMGDPFSTGEERMMKRDPSFGRDPTDVTAMCRRMLDAGVQVMDTSIDFDKIVETGEPRLDVVARQIRQTAKLDTAHVDHRKIVTIDGRIAYTGSANFGAQYLYHRPFDPRRPAREEADEARRLGLPEPWWKWHDGFVRFEGPIALELDRVFHERWRLGGGDDFRSVALPSRNERGVPVEHARVLKNEPSSQPNEIRAAFLEHIAAARKTIFIENPYCYHPDIVDALLAASRRSVKVTLIGPGRTWNDNAFAQDAQQHHYPAYVDAGIEVLEYQNHFTHLKLAVFDHVRSIVGSANLNYRSLEDDKDFEACVLVEGETFARKIEREVLAVDRVYSRRITADDLRGTVDALRMRVRHPVTLAMLNARVL